MRLRSVCGICGLLLLASIQVHAQSITIQNSGFESPALGDNASAGVNAPLLIGTNSSTVSNWTLSASSLLSVSLSVPARAEIINPSGPGPVNISGSQIGLLRANGLAGVGTFGSAYQDLGVSYTANSRYTLSADVGVESLASLLSGYGFSLMNGSNTLATRDQSTLLTLLLNSNQLYHASLTFDTNGTVPTGNVGVQFFESSLANVAGAFIFDNVSLSVTAIPEPTTIGLIALSFVGVATAYYRQRRIVKRQMEASL